MLFLTIWDIIRTVIFEGDNVKIVNLDGCTTNPGDLSWDGIKRFGEYTVYDRTSPHQIIERAKGAEIA